MGTAEKLCVYFCRLGGPLVSTLFPYTTLFRSKAVSLGAQHGYGVLLRIEQITGGAMAIDRKSTRLNSSHSQISYAVFCSKKKIAPGPSATAGPSPTSCPIAAAPHSTRQSSDQP